MPRRDEEQGQCRDLAALVALAERRGYARPLYWATQVLIARERRVQRRADSTRHLKGRPWA